MKVVILFLAMFAGIYARIRGYIDWKTTKAFSSFLVNVTNPLLIIYSFQLDFDSEQLKIGIHIFILSAIVHSVLALIAFFVFKPVKDKQHRSIYSFALIFANCGFIGYPVLMAMFGNIGLFYGAFFTAYFNIFVWTYGVVLMCREREGEKLPLKKVFLNSGTVAIVVGLFLFAFSIRLPYPIYQASKLVGDMTFPLSMVIIGSLVVGIDFKSLLKSPSIYLFSAIKLVLVPLIAIGACYLLKLPAMLSYICIVMCAMPSATNTAIFAEIYDNDSILAAKCVGVTTLLSLVTIPLTIYLANLVL
jgi:Predicted permeases